MQVAMDAREPEGGRQAESTDELRTENAKILVADSDRDFASALASSLRSVGYRVECVHDLRGLKNALKQFEPCFLVTELRLDDGPILPQVAQVKDVAVIVLTKHESLASVGRCAKLGIKGFLSKPAALDEILQVIEGRLQTSGVWPDRPMTLQRAIWEYVNDAVEAAGSITKAAELLGIERRSLRRMLLKGAP